MDIPSGMPELIAEEAKDAMKYADLALKHRADHPELADLFMELSEEELHHMQMISDKMAGMMKALHEQYNRA